VADLGGDEIPEVIAVKERGVPDPDRAEIYAFSPHAIPVPGFPLVLEGLAYAMPTVCDLDDDGLAEILIGDLTHRLYRFDIDFAFNPDRESHEWHRLQKDLAHTGRWTDPSASAVNETASAPAVRLVAVPNPFRGWTEIRGAGADEGADGSGWSVYDLEGRLVRMLRRGPDGGIRWAGDREGGGVAPPGTYFVRARGPGKTVRVLRLR
jgi:hypothetical protein